MAIITLNEFQTLRIFELDNRIFNKIETAFRKILGDMARKFLESNLMMTLRELSTTSYVDVMSCFTII